MAKKAVYNSTKRFGPRYGKKNRERFGALEQSQRNKHKCPYCHYKTAKRVATGIWECTKCSSKFTSKAYSVEKPQSIKIEVEE